MLPVLWLSFCDLANIASHRFLLIVSPCVHNVSFFFVPTIFIYRLFHEQNRDVAKKLGLATAGMFTVPILVYYASERYLFATKAEPSNWAAGLAILATNVIVGLYVYAAFQEDESDFSAAAKAKQQEDANAPRVGIYKQRTD